jgi:ABC-type multidrug transport system permease subunit
MKGRIIQTVILALFTGAIYWRIPKGDVVNMNQRAIWDKNGFLFFNSISLFMSSMNPVILTFPAERGVFLKEENAKLYKAVNYFIGRTLIEIPFLIFAPVVWAMIIYWMIELNDDSAGNILFFIFVCILQSFCGNSLGLLGGSAFPDPKIAMGLLPILMLPFMLFAGFYSNLM